MALNSANINRLKRRTDLASLIAGAVADNGMRASAVAARAVDIAEELLLIEERAIKDFKP